MCPRADRRRRPHLRGRHGLERRPHEGGSHLGVHGVDDSVVAVTESIHMAGALRASGGNVKLTLIPETNHNAWEPALRDFQVVQWMMMYRLSDRA